MAKDLVSVRFIAKASPYNGGERAGFPPAKAADLVRRELAVYVNAEDAPADLADRADGIEDSDVEGLPEGYRMAHVGGGYQLLFGPDDAAIRGPNNGKFRGEEAALEAARAHADAGATLTVENGGAADGTGEGGEDPEGGEAGDPPALGDDPPAGGDGADGDPQDAAGGQGAQDDAEGGEGGEDPEGGE